MKKSMLTIVAALASLSAMANAGLTTESAGAYVTDQAAYFTMEGAADYEPSTATYAVAEGESTLDFRYFKHTNFGVYRTGEGEDVENSAAIYLPQGVVERYAGNRVTSMKICSGTNKNTNKNNVTDVTVWAKSTLDGEPIFTQRGRLSRKSNTWTEIILDKPVEIKADQPIYFGMTVIRPTGDDYVFVADRVKNEQGCSFWVNYMIDGEYKWDDWSGTFGALCMQLTMVGNNLPHNDVAISNFSCPAQVGKGKTFEMTFMATNHGVEPIKQLTFEVTIGDDQPVKLTFNAPADQLQSYNDDTTIGVTGVCNTYGTSVPIQVKLLEVNGVADTYEADNTVHASTLCLDDDNGYRRTLVFEEGTGTWCGYCPRGAAAITYMNRKYPDGSFIGIAAHQGDPMEITDTDHSYRKQFQMMTGYPHARFNRIRSYGNEVPTRPTGTEDIYNEYMKLPAVCKISFNAYFNDTEKTELNLEAVTQYAFDNRTEYRVAYVLLEDNLGPYPQSNNYAGANYDMEGWEQLPSTAIVKFDHVARYIDDYEGVEDSQPIVKKAGVNYHYDTVLPINTLKSLDNFAVVAMLINCSSGEIENASIVHCNADLEVRPRSSIAEIGTDETPAEWYTIGGVRVDEPSTSGMYIKVVGGKATKVMVK